MAFSIETAALLALGYSLTQAQGSAVNYPSGLGADDLAYVSNLLTKIDALTLEMDSNLSDSMAVKVQDLGLDYSRYLSLAKARGSRYLQELSTALGTPVAFDRFSGVAANGDTQTAHSIAVPNYY